MLTRKQAVHARMKLAFTLFAGVLLLAFWLAGLVYYFFEERSDVLENARAQATLIASQSSAAVMFDDRDLLNAQLSILSQVENVRWALIAVADPLSSRPGGLRVIAHYTSLPQDLDELQRSLVGLRQLELGLTAFRLVEPVTHNGETRANLYMEINFESRLRHFLATLFGSLLLALFLLWLGRIVFERILASVSGPIGELASLAERVTAAGITADRAADEAEDEVGQLARAMNKMLDGLALHEADLARSRDELRALTIELQRVREEERTRISHEIHDELGQRMTAIKYEIARLTKGEVRERLSAMTEETIKVVRNISWELRPSLLDSLGLLAAIEWLGKDFERRTDIDCKLSLPETLPALNPACSTDVFRMCQELLTNVARHARTHRVDIHLAEEDAELVLEVEDYGVGFDAAKSRTDGRSLGLLGVSERAVRWGGCIEINSGAGQGTSVRVRLPVDLVQGSGEMQT